MLKTLVSLLVLLASSSLALAETPERRTISVSGSADIKVAPDEIEFTLGIETRDKNLLVAKKQNSEKLHKTQTVLRGLGIESKHIQTDYVSIQPDYSNSDHLTPIGYQVQRTLAVILKDPSKFETLLTEILQAGVNHVHSIDFRTTELRKHRDRARALAIQAAREKAVALAKELGQKVGHPTSISEGGGGWYGPGRYWGGRYGGGMSQNVQQSSGSGPSESGGLSLGQIAINATVSVVFELE